MKELNHGIKDLPDYGIMFLIILIHKHIFLAYFMTGFLSIQHALDMAIIDVKNNVKAGPKISLNPIVLAPLPMPDYIDVGTLGAVFQVQFVSCSP